MIDNCYNIQGFVVNHSVGGGTGGGTGSGLGTSFRFEGEMNVDFQD